MEGTDCVLIKHKGGRVKTIEIDPAAYWKLDGDATDSSGNAHDGTTIGDPSWTTGVNEGAIQLNGIDQYVAVPHHPQLKPELPLTLSAWINIDVLGTKGLIIKTDSWGDPYNYSGAYLRLRSSGSDKIALGYGDSTGTGPSHRRTKIGTTVLQTDRWYHVTGVIRGPQDMSIYIDAVDDGGDYHGTGGEIAYTDNDLSIGSRNGTDSFFPGAIDDVRIYDRALSQEQVTQLYQLTEPTEPVTR
jgi:hypothetical protein